MKKSNQSSCSIKKIEPLGLKTSYLEKCIIDKINELVDAVNGINDRFNNAANTFSERNDHLKDILKKHKELIYTRQYKRVKRNKPKD